MYGLTKKEVLAELKKIGYSTFSELKEHLRAYERYADSIGAAEDNSKDAERDKEKKITWY